MRLAASTLAFVFIAAQAMAADQSQQQTDKPVQAANSSKEAKSDKEKPRMKSVEEVWGKGSKYGNGLPRLGPLADDVPAQQVAKPADVPTAATNTPKDVNGNPRMKSVEEVWGNGSKYGKGFPRLGGLDK